MSPECAAPWCAEVIVQYVNVTCEFVKQQCKPWLSIQMCWHVCFLKSSLDFCYSNFMKPKVVYTVSFNFLISIVLWIINQSFVKWIPKLWFEDSHRCRMTWICLHFVPLSDLLQSYCTMEYFDSTDREVADIVVRKTKRSVSRSSVSASWMVLVDVKSLVFMHQAIRNI